MHRVHVLVASLLLPIVGACASQAPTPVGGPFDPTAVPAVDEAELESRALLLLLSDRRIYEPYTVERILTQGPAMRRFLAQALGRAATDRAVPVLEGLLLDSDASVRRAAAFALGAAGDETAVDSLLAAAIDPDPATGQAAVQAAAILGADLTPVLAALLEEPPEQRWARLLPSLFRFDDPVRVNVAGAALDDDSLRGEGKRWAAYALGRGALPEALPRLRALLASDDPWIRGWAARGLGQVGGRDDLIALRPLLDDAAPGPTIQALRAARSIVRRGEAAAPPEWREPLLALLGDSRTGVRLAAFEVVGSWLLDDLLGPAVLARATGEVEASDRERDLALLALAEAGHPRALELTGQAARRERPTARIRAAEAAGLLGALPLVQDLLEDEHPGVRSSALGVLLAREREADRIRLLKAALEDSDPAVRATALDTLAATPLLPVEALAAALGASRNDRIPTARLAAVRALAARAEAEPLERGGIILALEDLALQEAFLLRRQAADALEALGRPRPAIGAAGPGRGMPVYRQIVQQTAVPRTVEIRTEKGAFQVRLSCPDTPFTCLSFLQLAGQGFYEGLRFHRVIPDFVAQVGDPRGDGWGGPGYSVRDETHRLPFRRGVVGMARSAEHDTAGSQFFVTLSDQPHLDGAYTSFGTVVRGMEVVDSLIQGDRIVEIVEVFDR